MADLLSGGEEAVLLAQLEASSVAEAARYAEDVDRLVRLERLSLRSGSTERGLEMELAGTLRIGQQAAALRLGDARRLTDALPLTLAALGTGALLVPQARIVLEETRHCTEPVAAAAERRVLAGLDVAQLAGWTARRLRSRLKAAVLAAEAALEPEHTSERERTARASRRVTVRPEPDGMASLWALLPADQLRTFSIGLDLLAARQRDADAAAGIERTADQRLADLLALLPSLALHPLDGTTAPADGSHHSVVVHVHVPMATALGLSDEPGDLAGYGPISAGTVRLLLPDARLRRVLVDACSGQPLHVDARTTAPARRRARPTSPTTSPTASRTVDPAAGVTASPTACSPASRPVSPTAGVTTSPPATSPASRAAALTASPTASHPPEQARSVERTLREALLGMLDDRPFLLDETPEPQYRPSRPLARLVQVRDQHCSGPGCSRPTTDADLDHRTPWPLGPTSAGNLAPLSRRCHRAKTATWSLSRARDGSHTWTSPVGRTYVVTPPWRPPPDPRPVRLPERTHPPGHAARADLTDGSLTDGLGPDSGLVAGLPPALDPGPRPGRPPVRRGLFDDDPPPF